MCSKLTECIEHIVELLQWQIHIIECSEGWWKNANKTLGLLVEKIENVHYKMTIFGNLLCCWPVVEMCPGNPPTFQVWTRKIVRFDSRCVPKLNPLCLGSTLGFQLPVVHVNSVNLWSHSDIVLIIAQYGHPNCIIFVICIGCHYHSNKEWHASYPILIINVNAASEIVGLPSWVIWMAMCCWHSYTT
jgi:hypothetical protein